MITCLKPKLKVKLQRNSVTETPLDSAATVYEHGLDIDAKLGGCLQVDPVIIHSFIFIRQRGPQEQSEKVTDRQTDNRRATNFRAACLQ